MISLWLLCWLYAKLGINQKDWREVPFVVTTFILFTVETVASVSMIANLLEGK